MTYFHNIQNAIKTMQSRYGVGDVQSIEIFQDGRIELTEKGFQMRPRVRRGRFVKGKRPHTTTIKMYRHQMTVIIIGD